MRILINALGATMGGATRHLRAFTTSLQSASTDKEFFFLCRHHFTDLGFKNKLTLLPIADSVAGNWLNRLFFDNFSIPKIINENKIDCVISLTNFGCIYSAVPHIVFQRNALYFCPWYLKNISLSEAVAIRLRRRLTFELMNHATVVVTPTNAMTRLIQDTYPQIPKQKFKTLYHGFELTDFGVPSSNEKKDSSAGKVIDLLYPTHPGVHKGFGVLIPMIYELSKKLDRNFRLLLTCSEKEVMESFPRRRIPSEWTIAKPFIEFLGQVPQNQMGALYEKADLMVYPSLCESFGFTMLESMGHALPIVAADTLTNREICKDAAVYYPALNPEAGAACILSALTGKLGLISKAKERMESFDWSWNRYSREFVNLIDETLGKAQRPVQR